MVISGRQRHAWLVAVPVALAIAGTSLPPLAAGAAPVVETYEDRTIPWSAAQVEPGGRSVLITFTGGGPPGLVPGQPCWTGFRPYVTETAETVTVTLVVLLFGSRPSGPPVLSGTGCTPIGYERTTTVDLHAPLGGRVIVDGATAAAPLVFAGPLRRPRFLPHGWKLLWQRGDLTDPERTVLWRQVWGPPGRAGRCGTSSAPIELTQGPITESFPYGPFEDADLVHWRGVGRVKAQVVVDRVHRQTVVRWEDRGTGYVLRRVPTCENDPLPRWELLVRVASSVR